MLLRLPYLSIRLFAIICILIYALNPAKAGHIIGAESGYKDLGNDSFLVYFDVYRDCNSTNITNMNIQAKGRCIGITANQQSLSQGIDITPVCNTQCTRCQSGSCSYAYGIELYRISSIIDVSQFKKNGCCEVTFSFTICCRSTIINTGPANTAFYSEGLVNICEQGPNNSPEFVQDRNTILCLGRNAMIDFGAHDSDKDSTGKKLDSLVFSLSDPLTSATGKASWNTNYSAQKPLNYLGFPKDYSSNRFPFGFHIDSTTGELWFRPMSVQTTTISFKVEEYRKGKLIGISRKEITVIINKCPSNDPPVISGLDCSNTNAANFKLSACAGKPICFEICTSDRDKTDSVKLKMIRAEAYATFTILNKGSLREKGRFCWTPTVNDISNKPYNFSFFASDNACPTPGMAARVFSITVVTPDTPSVSLTNRKTNNSCGEYELYAASKDSIVNAEINWFLNDSVKLQSSTNKLIDTLTHNFAKNGRYPILVEIKRNKCYHYFRDTVNVTGVNEIQLAVKDTKTCANPVVNIPLKASGGNGNFTYAWTDNLGIWYKSDSVYLSTDSVKYPIRTNIAITVRATDSLGCFVETEFNILKKKRTELQFVNDTTICDSNVSFKLPKYPGPTHQTDWKGPGVTNNQFSNIGLDTGNLYLSYVVEYDGDCYVDKKKVTNQRASNLKLDNDKKGCPEMVDVQLNATPKGGYWQGSHVDSMGLFSPNFPASGVYTNTYHFSNKYGCKNSDSMKIEIVKYAINADAGKDTSLCIDSDPIKLAGSPANGKWLGNYTEINNEYFFDPSGFITNSPIKVEYVVIDSNGCFGYDSVFFTVLPQPTVDAGSDISHCLLNTIDTINLNASPVGGTWSGAGFVGKIDNLPVDSTFFGTNNFLYSYTDKNGCMGSDAMNLTVSPTPKINAGEGDTLCNSGILRYDFKPVPNGGLWRGPGTINKNVVIIPRTVKSPAKFTYTFINNFGCQAVDSLELHIGNPVKSSFSASDTDGIAPLVVDFTNTGSGEFFNWDFDDGGTSTDENPTYTFINPGIYYVKLRVTDSLEHCKNSSQQRISVGQTGVNDPLNHPEIELYPTVTSNQFLAKNLTKTPCNIIFYGQTGEIVQAFIVEQELQISVGNWAKGLYYYKVSNENQMLEMGKVVVE